MATATPSIFSLINSSTLWSSFWGDLLAGLILLVLASWLVPTLLSWRRMPSVRLLDFKRRRNTFTFNAIGEEWEATLRLVIQNRGNNTLEKYYWEIYAENGLNIDMSRIAIQPGHATIGEEPGDKFTRLYGYMVLPIFPLDDVDFPFEIKIKIPERRTVRLYYFFRTEYGQSPFWSWFAQYSGRYSLLKNLIVQ